MTEAPPGTTTSAPPPAPTPAPTPATGEGEEAAPAVPTAVTIPALGVDEQLIDLGIAASGELDVPADAARVGWFTEGGRPGGRGPTVLVGHLDSATGPAVFSDLPDLVAGDEVTVTTENGTTVTYAVTRTEDFLQDDFPTAAVFGATADDQLRLITCTGPYDRAAGRYTENRVVFAEPVA